ncbi:MAG: 3-keto-5-aminohexanoate cleavage protein [Gammaproteobacteria bacterium HGW-Gammaproteobacteria-11]|nr:MAG: 3-keto-5-aminohexanoate cleavage protein [Gammaproteobacteria bacterium HGW-Gammaproteobacteria-11]
MITKPYIISLAPTGIIPTKAQTPHVPVSQSEILDTVAECLELGVQMFHLHTRTPEQTHNSDPQQYGRLIEAIRTLPGGQQAILCVTTSGRQNPSFEERARILDLDGDMKPDMASLTLSSLNFQRSASINEPDVIRQLAARMQERGIKPELEIFDFGMLNMARVLMDEGLVDGHAYANLLFGNISSAQCTPLQMATLLREVPDNLTCCIAGLGRFQLQANLFGLMFADGVRVGLEDNIWYDQQRSQLATNVNLVKRIRQLGEQLERPLMSSQALRDRLLSDSSTL